MAEPTFRVRTAETPSFLVQHPPIVLGVKRTDAEIDELVRQVLTDLKGEMICSNDIISRSEVVQIVNTEAALFYNYHKYGLKFLDFIQYSIQLEQLRSVSDLAIKQVQRERVLKYPISSQVIASSSLGFGECHEINSVLTLKCNLLGINTLMLMVGNQLEKLDKGHVIILIGVDEKEYKNAVEQSKGSLIKTLKILRGGFVLDGFLNTFFPIKELATRGADFERYMNANGFQWVAKDMLMNDKSILEVPKMQEEAALIFRAANNILKIGHPIHSHRSPGIEVLKAAERSFTALGIILELQKIFPNPNITWKKNLKGPDIKIWGEGSKEDTEAASEFLQNLGIEMRVGKMKSKPGEALKYAGFLANPNLRQFSAKIKAKQEISAPVGAAAPAAPPVSADAPAASAAPTAPVEEKKALPGS